MKRKIITALTALGVLSVLLTGSVASADSYPWESEYTPDSDTVALLHLNEGAGGMAYDSSSASNDGIVSNAAWTADGKFGSALEFDGSLSYILMPSGFGDMDQGTIEMWVRPAEDINGPTGYQQFFFMKGNTYGHTGAHQFIISSNTLSYIKFDHYPDGWMSANSGELTWEAGRWYHVAATWGPAGMHVFRDGVELGSNPYTGHGIYNAYIPSSIGNWAQQAPHLGYRGFLGTIDEFHVSTVQKTYLGVANLPPVITSLTADPGRLWPPNNKANEITVSVTATDPDGPDDIAGYTYSVIDEYGEYDVPDTALPDDGVISLVAARNGNDSDGRVYTVTVKVHDQAGVYDSESIEIVVRHDQGK